METSPGLDPVMPRRFFFRLFSAAVPAGDHATDDELLRRFAAEQDSAAFELLIRRHADTVWTACRGVLGSEADAEDAFQATFLVLARKARTIRSASVGGWLHRVAVNAALKLRERLKRVASVTAEQLATLPARAPQPDSELAALVQEELALLPERYRLPVVLCELEGHTHAEAAQVLGWPVGSVSSRLSRARALLRNRLARRGINAPAVILPAIGLPPALVRDTAAVATGAAPIPQTVSILTQGVLHMMRTTKIQLIAIGLLSVGLVAIAGFGTYTVLAQSPASPPTEPITTPVSADQKAKPTISQAGDSITAYPDLEPKSLEDLVTKCPKTLGDKKIPIGPNDSALVQLQKAKLNAALANLSLVVERLKAGAITDATSIPEACNRAVAAAEDVFPPSELTPWFEERVRVAKWFEKVIAAQVEAGASTVASLNTARFARLDAEIALLKLTSRKER